MKNGAASGPGSSLALGATYFILPLIATLRILAAQAARRLFLRRLPAVFGDPNFQATFTYSVVVAVFTILLGVLLVVPTAYWIRLRLPHLRPIVEFITLLPLVIPAIVIVFGYIRMYGSNSPLPFLGDRARHRRCCWSSAMRRWRCPICTAPSTPVSGPSTCAR